MEKVKGGGGHPLDEVFGGEGGLGWAEAGVL